MQDYVILINLDDAVSRTMARRLRAEHIYCRIMPASVPVDLLLQLDRDGLEFDAVLTSGDSLAVAALKYARAAGKRVPEDLSVIGYDNGNLCLATEPELTSVDNKLQAICDHIVTTMLGVLDGKEMPQKTVFTGELIKRASTK